jgi:HAD superfamily hydrolase (TIGR01549 family)
MIKAVLFDLGDTLINFGKVDKTAAIKQAARSSYDYLNELNQPTGPFWAYFLRNMLEIRLRCIWSDITGKDFDSFDVMKKIGRKRGFNITPQQWLEVNWLWYKPLAKLAYIEPDIVQTMTTLKNMGLRLGILSNTFVGKEALKHHLKEIGIYEFFELRLYSCYYPYRKPDKRIFFDAVSEMGLSKDEVLFVGDRVDTDAAGCIAADIKCVLKKSHANEDKQTPPQIGRIDTISELPQFIADKKYRS